MDESSLAIKKVGKFKVKSTSINLKVIKKKKIKQTKLLGTYQYQYT